MALPPGFTLDEESTKGSAQLNLPKGFELDTEPAPEKKAQVNLPAGFTLDSDQPVKEEKPGIIKRALQTTVDIAPSVAKGTVTMAKPFIRELQSMGAKEQEAQAKLVEKLTGKKPEPIKPTFTMDDLKKAEDYLQSLKSKGTQAAEKDVQEAQGFVNTIKAYLKNPSAIVSGVSESVPSMVGASRVAKVISKAGVPGWAAVGVGEGAVTAPQVAEQIREQQGGKDLTAEQKLIAAESGVLTGVFGAFGGKIANKLGIADFDQLLAGVANKQVSSKTRSKLIAATEAALTESTFEELPQSIQEQIATNLASGQPWNKGVAEAAASGLLLGAVPGAGAGYVNQARANRMIAEKSAESKIDDIIAQQAKQGVTRDQLKSSAFDDLVSKADEVRAKTKPAPIAPEVKAVEEEVFEPSTTLDKATLTSLGIKPNSIAGKALVGTDLTTEEGRTFFDTVIEKNPNLAINEDLLDALLAKIPQDTAADEMSLEEADVISKTETTPDRVSVQPPSELGGEAATVGAGESDVGGVGAIGDVTRQPDGREGIEPSTLKSLAEQYAAEEPITQEEEEVAPTEYVEPVTPESSEVVKFKEDLKAIGEELESEDQLKVARSLQSELRALDPYHPMLEDLGSPDVTAEDMAAAREEIDAIKAEKAKKEPTSQRELRELREEMAATEGEPEAEAKIKTEDELVAERDKEIARYTEQINALEQERAKLQETVDLLDSNRRSPKASIEAAKAPYLEKIAELDERIKNTQEAAAQTRREYDTYDMRGWVLNNEGTKKAIDALVKEGVITEKESALYRAIDNGDVVSALDYIENNSTNKWYRTIAKQLYELQVFPSLYFGNLPAKTLGQYFANYNSVAIDAGYYIQEAETNPSYKLEETLLHELLHAATVNSVVKAYDVRNRVQNNLEVTQNLQNYINSKKDISAEELLRINKFLRKQNNIEITQDLQEYLGSKEYKSAIELLDIYDFLKEKHPDIFTKSLYYGATNPLEMIAEAFADRGFQNALAKIALPESFKAPEGKQTVWLKLLDAIKNMLGLAVPNNALRRILEHSTTASRVSPKEATPYEELAREKFYEKYKSTGNAEAKKANKQIDQLQAASGVAKAVPQASKNIFRRVMDTDIKRAMDSFSTAVFSSDNALNNELRRGMEKAGLGFDKMKEIIHMTMTSQALHHDNISAIFLERGGIRYNDDIFNFEVYENPKASWGKMMKDIKTLAEQYGMKFDKMEHHAHTYFVARRAKDLNDKNAALKKKVMKMLVDGKKKQAKQLWDKGYVLVHMTPAEIKAGLGLGEAIPELNNLTKQWDSVRQEVVNLMTFSGLYSEEYANNLLDTAAYVPFYREAQIEAKQGPKEYTRGLLDRASDPKIKGSFDPVNNVFDNMERWVTYAIGKSIGNYTAQNALKAMQEFMPDQVSAKPLSPETKSNPGNTVAIWQNGQLKRYHVEDPLFVHYFTGAQSAFTPLVKFFAPTNKFFRGSIILDPIFSLKQVFMDAQSAMFTSGVKYPMKLPILALKEFFLTIPNWSRAHKELRSYGAVGETDYSAVASRIAREAEVGLREPNLFEKVVGTALKPLKHIAMASDNSIRQAVYLQTLKETGDKALAISRAFEVINFRRSGASAVTNTARQTVPFFGAYLQVMNVLGKIITGKGIAPTTKAQARLRLASALGQYALLTFIIMSMVNDDDEYKDADPTTKDLRMFVPGLTDKGIWLPVRADPFTFFSKFMVEHIMNLSKDSPEGEDWTKFGKAMRAYIANAVLGPTPMPQLAKVAFEMQANQDTAMDRSIVGQGVAGRETERQYTMQTSEFAKAIGSTGLISPMMVDYLMHQLTGSLGSVTIFAYDKLIADSNKPPKSTRDTIAQFAPGFVKKEFGSRAKNDLYELRDLTDEAYATYTDINKYATYEDALKANERLGKLLTARPQVEVFVKQLAAYRAEERQLIERNPENLSKEEIAAQIRRIRMDERELLKNIEIIRMDAGLDEGNIFRNAGGSKSTLPEGFELD